MKAIVSFIKRETIVNVWEEGHENAERRPSLPVPIYILLFLLALPVVGIMDRRTLIHIDYALLFTFVGFFIFTGNIGSLPSVQAALTQMVSGREVEIGIVASQFISNVPAALLLSGFTEDYSGLILGTDLGGLGTLIASMASLISFKFLAHSYNEKKGRYFLTFTGLNVLFLVLLYGEYIFIN